MIASTIRRNFLRMTTAAVGMPTIIPSAALGLGGSVAPANRISMAAIGIGPRGRLVLDKFLKQPDARFVAFYEPYKVRTQQTTGVLRTRQWLPADFQDAVF